MASKTVGTLSVRLEAQTEQFNRAMEKAKGQAQRFARQARETSTAADEMGRAFRSLLPAISLVALVSFTRRTIEAGDAMAKQARILGVTVDQYYALESAAIDAGIGQEQLVQGLKKFGSGVGRAALTGKGSLNDLLVTFKINLRDANDQLKPTSELLSEVAGAINSVENPLLRLKLTGDAFGTRASALVDILPELGATFSNTSTDIGRAATELERADKAIDSISRTLLTWSILGLGEIIERTKLAFGSGSTESQLEETTDLLRQNIAIYKAAQKRGTDAEGLARISAEYDRLQARIRSLTKQREEETKATKRTTVSYDELLERIAAEEKSADKKSRRRSGAGDGVRRNWDWTDPWEGRPARRDRSRDVPIDFEIGRGPIEGGFAAFRSELTDTQQLITSSTQTTMSTFTAEIGNALTSAEFRFDQFATSVLSSIAQIVTSQLLTKFITTPFLGLLGVKPLAAGNAFARGRVTAFASGGVVSRPTLFQMANGAGLMGEAGPEAVLPLKRTSSGQLGVVATGGGGAGTFAPSVTINYTPAAGGKDDKEAPRSIAGEVRRQLEDFWRTQYRRETRSGGVLNPIA